MTKKLTVKDVARLMGKSEMFVRIGIQKGILPIGIALKTSSRYSYYINPSLVEQYLGTDIRENTICTMKKKEDKI